MINKVKKFQKDSQGAVVIDATFVYPIMFFIIFFLIYMGNMYYLKSNIDSVVAQEAIKYASYFADPLLETVTSGEKYAVPTSTDAKVTENLYRYVNVFSANNGVATDEEESKLIQKISDTGFFADMMPTSVKDMIKLGILDGGNYD